MVGIAEACHEKQILDCPCDLIGPVRVEDKDGNVIFFDCYDNVDWALTFVQNFIDNSGSSSVTPTPAGPSSRELMDKHNAQVGRKVGISGLVLSCVHDKLSAWVLYLSYWLPRFLREENWPFWGDFPGSPPPCMKP